MPAVGGWYRQLRKPAWTPPDRVFGPLWTLLYALMALAAWRIWSHLGFVDGARELGLFVLSLGFNLLWSCLFFQLHLPRVALADLALLWMTILLLVLAFGAVDALAAWLLVPYLLWVTFAGTLNAPSAASTAEWRATQLNRQPLSVA